MHMESKLTPSSSHSTYTVKYKVWQLHSQTDSVISFKVKVLAF
jgi:hypothetical protein